MRRNHKFRGYLRCGRRELDGGRDVPREELDDGRRELELGRGCVLEGLDGAVGRCVEGRDGVTARTAGVVLPNCTESPSMAERAC